MSLTVPGFKLEQTYKTPQAIRWQKKLLVDKFVYIVPSVDECTAISQNRDKLLFYCSSGQVFDYWYSYLDLKQDYFDLKHGMSSISTTLSKQAKDCFGMHMLRLDLWESMLVVLMLRKSSLKKARRNMELLCKVAGEAKTVTVNSAKFKWYTTPDSEAIVRHKDELLQYRQFKAVVDLAETFDELGDFTLLLMRDMNSAKENLNLLKKTGIFTAEEAKKVLSWSLGSKLVSISKAQNKEFEERKGQSFKLWVKDNLAKVDEALDGRLDYLCQIICMKYINDKKAGRQ